jgi:hypothetical protein
MSRVRWLAVVGGIGVAAAIFGMQPAGAAGVGVPKMPMVPPAGDQLLCTVAAMPPGQCEGAGEPMTSHGGRVQASPAVYIVYWGWHGNDPSGQAPYQEAFFNGVGGSDWNASQTQYCSGATTLVKTGIANSELFPNGLSAGSSCPSGATFVGNPTGLLHGTWSDETNPMPASPTDADVEAEAVRAAAFFGNVTAASNDSAQYVIDTPQGNGPAGFPAGGWCSKHAAALGTAYGDITYTTFPYLTDAGTRCGQNFVNAGAAGLLDGVSIVGGHEFAETETDPDPHASWADSSDQETGDKCVWIAVGPGAAHDITLSTGTFAVQTLWSNTANAGAGGCVG